MKFREIIELAKKRGLQAREANRNDGSTAAHGIGTFSRQEDGSEDRRGNGGRGSANPAGSRNKTDSV